MAHKKYTSLSPCELEIMAELLKGNTAKEIGKNLGKSRFTVHAQLISIKKKLSAKSSSHAVAIYKSGLATASTSIMNPLLKERVWLIGRPAYHHITQFALPVDSDSLRILDVAAGVSDFMSVWKNGLAVDPCYAGDYQELFNAASHDLFLFAANQIQNDRNGTCEHIRHYDLHRQALTGFLIDFGNRSGSVRYRADTLPDLPLVCGRFDLAICSHFLFLYENAFEFEVAAIRRVMELTNEFRIWPLPSADLHRRLATELPQFLFTRTFKFLSITV